jgi:23S rRNA (adenine2030-N6)-methyltransferase
VLQDQLKQALPQMAELLQQDSNAGYTLESGGN